MEIRNGRINQTNSSNRVVGVLIGNGHLNLAGGRTHMYKGGIDHSNAVVLGMQETWSTKDGALRIINTMDDRNNYSYFSICISGVQRWIWEKNNNKSYNIYYIIHFIVSLGNVKGVKLSKQLNDKAQTRRYRASFNRHLNKLLICTCNLLINLWHDTICDSIIQIY